MRRRKKLHLTTVIFLIMAILSIVFVLSDSINRDNKMNVNYPDITISKSDYKTNNKNKPTEKPNFKNTNPVEIKKETDWRPIFEKYKGKEVSSIKTDKKIVALTFDAGGNADGVDKILEILEKENIKGSFFLTGNFISKFPEKTEKIIKNGGDLGNHSYSHPYFTQISDEKIKEELEKTEDQLSKLGAKFQPFFRFPYGNRDARTMLAVYNKGYMNIRWTIDTLGWEGTSEGMTKELVENKVLSKIQPGSIVMMHLGSNPTDKTHLDSEALPDIIKSLREQEYEFVTLTKLLTLGT